ncbi:MAG TPA: ABC transporter ATP-binding protein [Solirubrobacteraceae bacterium]|nr:ABC transporter ATP-binding protein [Solirubrobacteraceae bacterium]
MADVATLPADDARDQTAARGLRVRGLTRRYGEREALDEVSFTLERGHTLVVFGPNGAGKSTLLRVLATLLRPHEGDVQVLGHRLPSEAWAVRGRVGLLGHEPLLYRELSPRENLRLHARLHGAREERIEELLDALAIPDRGGEPLRNLSRGTVQRVAVARTVLHEPELLLLDEPYANLDPAAVALVAPLIGPGGGCDGGGDGGGDVSKTGGPRARARTRAGPPTRVVCSHDPARGLEEADVVLGLRAGRVALLAPAAGTHAKDIGELYR